MITIYNWINALAREDERNFWALSRSLVTSTSISFALAETAAADFEDSPSLASLADRCVATMGLLLANLELPDFLPATSNQSRCR